MEKIIKFLYVTDLHGNKDKYEQILQIAIDQKVGAIINGGDMFPYKDQDYFLKDFLPLYFDSLPENMHYVCLLGNDDLGIHDVAFDTLCSSYSNVHNIAQRKIELFGHEIIGMNYVLDYPFRLKDRCRKDDQYFVQEVQFGTALFSTSNSDKDIIDVQNAYSSNVPGYKEMGEEDYKEYLTSKRTIEEELKNLPKPTNSAKCIYVFHQPPAKLGLDVCGDGRRVGSDAIFRFLCNTLCFCSLHGHIHESPVISMLWKNTTVNNNIVIQPGQGDGLSYYVIIEENVNHKSSGPTLKHFVE